MNGVCASKPQRALKTITAWSCSDAALRARDNHSQTHETDKGQSAIH
jgi:hypothetical protein